MSFLKANLFSLDLSHNSVCAVLDEETKKQVENGFSREAEKFFSNLQAKWAEIPQEVVQRAVDAFGSEFQIAIGQIVKNTENLSAEKIGEIVRTQLEKIEQGNTALGNSIQNILAEQQKTNQSIAEVCRKLQELKDGYDCELSDINKAVEASLEAYKKQHIDNLRQNLLNAVHEEFLDKEAIKLACRELKKFLPQDFQAEFYEVICGGNVNKINNFILNIDLSQNGGYVKEIVEFMCKILKKEYFTSLQNLLDRARVGHYITTDVFGRLNRLYNTQAQKVDDQVFNSSLPRDVFIAYKSENLDKVIELMNKLEAENKTCYAAFRNLQHGFVEFYEEEIKKAINACKIFVFVSSFQSRTEGDALKELEYVKKEDVAIAEKNGIRNANSCYGDLNSNYKKLRLEYVIEEYYNASGEVVVKDFFAGYERAYDLDDAVARIARAITEYKPIGGESVKASGDKSRKGGIRDAKPEQTTVVSPSMPMPAANGNIANLLKRAYMFAEDGDFANANTYAERVLDIDSECAEAYVVKLMCESKVKKLSDLATLMTIFVENKNYQKAIRFGNAELKEKLNGYIAAIKDNQKEQKYKQATKLMNSQSENDILDAKTKFLAISDWKDSKVLADQCVDLAEKARKNSIYSEAINLLQSNRDILTLQKAKELFLSIPDWKDSKALANECGELIEEIRKDKIYSEATAFFQKGDIPNLQKAKEMFLSIPDWKDSESLATKAESLIKLAIARAKIVPHANKIAARDYHTIGLKSDGKVVVVGGIFDEFYISEWRDIVAVAAGDKHTVGLKSDGTVVAVGWNKDGQCNVSDWRDIVAIAAGEDHTVGLKSDGTVVAVGPNGYGQYDVSKWRDIVAITAGGCHTVGLKSDGTVVAVGWCSLHDVSEWQDIVAVAAGYAHTVGLKSDGTVVAVGGNSEKQCNVSNWKLFHTKEGLEAEKAALETELSQLKGIFSGGKRKKIQERLVEIEREMAKL
jgi:hypothetical protein